VDSIDFLTCCRFSPGDEFFIGSHLAELLKRETFNLYGSLKRRDIGTWHVDDNLLKLLVSKGPSSSTTFPRFRPLAWGRLRVAFHLFTSAFL
jgi:hypothetical protein